jgi:hypothetical protein
VKVSLVLVSTQVYKWTLTMDTVITTTTDSRIRCSVNKTIQQAQPVNNNTILLDMSLMNMKSIR